MSEDVQQAGRTPTRGGRGRNRGEDGVVLMPRDAMTTEAAPPEDDGRDGGRDSLGPSMDEVQAEDMVQHAETASSFLKALSHEGRLMILCHLSTGEKSVTELETLLSSRQAAVSQQLARLRLEGLVSYRREGKAIYYSLADEKARRLLELMHDMFCTAKAPPRAAEARD